MAGTNDNNGTSTNFTWGNTIPTMQYLLDHVVNGPCTPQRNVKWNHQDVYDDCGPWNAAHEAQHGCTHLAKLNVRPMWHAQGLTCEAFDHVGSAFVRCDATADTICGAFAEDGKWISRIPQLGTTYDPVRAKRWNVCDMHTPVRSWLPMMLFLLICFPTPAQGLSEDEGLGSYYDAKGWALKVLAVGIVVFLMGLLVVLDRFGGRLAEAVNRLTDRLGQSCDQITARVGQSFDQFTDRVGQSFDLCTDRFSRSLDVLTNRVGSAIDNFAFEVGGAARSAVNEYREATRRQLAVGVALTAFSFVVGLSGLAFTAGANSYHPEGRFRTNLSRAFKVLAGFCSFGALLQAAWGDTKGAKEGPMFWSSLFRDNYLVWGCNNVWKIFRNWWAGRAWNDGMVDADPRNLSTTKPKSGWSWAKATDAEDLPVDNEDDTALPEHINQNYELKQHGGVGVAEGDLVLSLSMKHQTDRVLTTCCNQILSAFSHTLLVSKAYVVGSTPWSYRLSAATRALSNDDFAELQRTLWQHRKHMFVAGDLQNIPQVCPTPRVLMLWFLALAGVEAKALWKRLLTSSCSESFDIDKPPSKDNYVDMTFICWLGAALGLAHHVQSGVAPGKQIVTFDLSRLYVQVCKVINADYVTAYSDNFIGPVNKVDMNAYEAWRKDVQNIRRIVNPKYAVCPVVLSFPAPEAEKCVSFELPDWAGVVVPEVQGFKKGLADYNTDPYAAEASREQVLEAQREAEFFREKELLKGNRALIEKETVVVPPPSPVQQHKFARVVAVNPHSEEYYREGYRAQALDSNGRRRLRALHAKLDKNPVKICSLYDILPNLSSDASGSFYPPSVEVFVAIHNAIVRECEDEMTISRGRLEEWREALDNWWKHCNDETHKEVQTKAETQWYAVHRTLVEEENKASWWSYVSNSALAGRDRVLTFFDEGKDPKTWSPITWMCLATPFVAGGLFAFAYWSNRTNWGRRSWAEQDDLLAKFYQENYPDGFWNGKLVEPEARHQWGRHKNRTHAPRPSRKAHPQHSGGVEVDAPDVDPHYMEYDADFTGEAKAATLIDSLAKKVSTAIDGVLDPTRVTAAAAAFATLKEVVGSVNVEDISDLKEKLQKTKGKLVPARRVGGRRVAVRQESMLGKKQLNVSTYLTRLFKVQVEEPGVLTTVTRQCNGWVHGDQLICVWHILRSACGVQNADGSYQVNQNFKKAWNATHCFTRAVRIVKLPDPYNDLGAISLVGITALGQRIPLTPPAPAERVWFVGWNHDHDGYEPKVATGIITANGIHNCPTEDGDCGGVLVSEDSGSVVGFHNGGGDVNNRSSPVSESLKKALKERVAMHLN